MELWDAYDINFNPIEGVTLVRGEEVPEGMYHLVCDILVKHTDGSYLLMQRDSRKHFGGMWEATAGGSALKGETPLQCAVRELSEETGVQEARLTEVGRIVHHRHRSIYACYLAQTACKKDSIVLQEGETAAYKWVSGEELRAMSPSELATKRMQCFVQI